MSKNIQGFSVIPVGPESPVQPPANTRAFPEDAKHLPPAKQLRPSVPGSLPQAQFNENPFVPRSMHPGLYR